MTTLLDLSNELFISDHLTAFFPGAVWPVDKSDVTTHWKEVQPTILNLALASKAFWTRCQPVLYQSVVISGGHMQLGAGRSIDFYASKRWSVRYVDVRHWDEDTGFLMPYLASAVYLHVKLDNLAGARQLGRTLHLFEELQFLQVELSDGLSAGDQEKLHRALFSTAVPRYAHDIREIPTFTYIARKVGNGLSMLMPFLERYRVRNLRVTTDLSTSSSNAGHGMAEELPQLERVALETSDVWALGHYPHMFRQCPNVQDVWLLPYRLRSRELPFDLHTLPKSVRQLGVPNEASLLHLTDAFLQDGSFLPALLYLDLGAVVDRLMEQPIAQDQANLLAAIETIERILNKRGGVIRPASWSLNLSSVLASPVTA